MNSFYKTYAFFLGVLLFSIFFVLKPPEGGDEKKRNTQEVATLEVNNFEFFTVAQQKPELMLRGKKGLQFKDREEFFDFYLTNFNPDYGGLKALKSSNNEESFYASKGMRKENKYYFSDKIEYKNQDGISFKAFKGNYDFKKRIFQSVGDFELVTQEGKIRGEDLYFDGKLEIVRANAPRGIIWLEN